MNGFSVNSICQNRCSADKAENPLIAKRSISSKDKAGLAKAAAIVFALIVSAYLMALALRAPDARWLGWVTLLPLFLAIRVLAPGYALLAGGCWGLCLSIFTSAGGDAALAPSIRSFALLTAIPGIYAFLGSVITRRVGFSPLLLALGWVGVELALQPLALHNGLLAQTQGNGLVIRAIGNIAGYVLVAFLLAYVNASLLEMLTGVCSVGSSCRRLLTCAGTTDARLVLREVPVYPVHFSNIAQPRAPPH